MQKNSFSRKNTSDILPATYHKAKEEKLGECRKVYPVLKQTTRAVFITLERYLLSQERDIHNGETSREHPER